MATPGIDCDISLTHPNVNAGQAVGFVCQRRRSGASGLVTLRRSAYRLADGSYQDRLHFQCTLLAADNLRAPNGADFGLNRAQVYAYLLAFLAARSGLTLDTPTGAWAGLFATLEVTVENLGHDSSEIVLNLNNGAAEQTAPIDWSRYTNSFWDGPLTWETSYWR